MSQHNPYKNMGPNLDNAATRIIPITPDDDNPLPQACKALRIWNPGAAEVTIHVVTSFGDDVILTIPAKALWTEYAVITAVKATNTDSGLIIHGYTD